MSSRVSIETGVRTPKRRKTLRWLRHLSRDMSSPTVALVWILAGRRLGRSVKTDIVGVEQC